MPEESITSLYSTDAYIEKNPHVHEEDSPWKISILKPLVDEFMRTEKGTSVTVLDVGGGAGIILRELAAYIHATYGVPVKKYCLDLSPGMLAIQQKNNPDAVKVIEGNIAATGMRDKEVDLVLMIDVLEHVAEPSRVLTEIRRISRAAIFKVPLEDSLYYRVMDRLTRGKFRARLIEKIGHIQVYNAARLRRDVEAGMGPVASAQFTNVYQYLLTTKQRLPDRLFNLVGSLCYRFSPALAAKIFNDYLVLLVRSRL